MGLRDRPGSDFRVFLIPGVRQGKNAGSTNCIRIGELIHWRLPSARGRKRLAVLALKMSRGLKLAQMHYNGINYLGGKRSNKRALAKLTRKRSEVRVFSSPP
jgi:hypothetical protein